MPAKQHNHKALKASDAKGHERKMKAMHGHTVVVVGHALPLKAMKSAGKKPANSLRGG